MFVVVRLARGLDVRWFALMFNLTVVLAAGLIGGLLGQEAAERGVIAAATTDRDVQRRAGSDGAPVTAILVLDVGTTSVRAGVVDDRLVIVAMAGRPFPPSTPFPGLVEFDAAELARLVLDAAAEVTAAVDEPVDRRRHHQPAGQHRSCGTGRPASRSARRSVGRTCAPSASASRPRPTHDLALAPNQSATKLPWLLDHVDGAATATSASAPSTAGSSGR